jgi:hypothetical protein
MESVTGIVTGIVASSFVARDHAALKTWYREHLGITITPTNYEDPPLVCVRGHVVGWGR